MHEEFVSSMSHTLVCSSMRGASEKACDWSVNGLRNLYVLQRQVQQHHVSILGRKYILRAKGDKYLQDIINSSGLLLPVD